MATIPKYTEREQTPAQRKAFIDAARAWNVAQGATPGPEAEGVYDRYIAGELTLQDVTDELVKLYTAAGATTARAGQPTTYQMQPEQLELV